MLSKTAKKRLCSPLKALPKYLRDVYEGQLVLVLLCRLFSVSFSLFAGTGPADSCSDYSKGPHFAVATSGL